MKGVLFKPQKIRFIAEHPDMEIQARWVIKPQPYTGAWDATAEHPSTGWFWKGLYQTWEGGPDFFKRLATYACYPQGETVYLKEAWKIEHSIKGCPKLDDIVNVKYADGAIARRVGDISWTDYGRDLPSISKALDSPDWQSACIMPEVIARHFIKILAVGAERLQEITEDRAKAEGVNPYLITKLQGGKHYRMIKTYHHENYPLVSHADEGEEIVFECPNMGFARCHHLTWQDGKSSVFRIDAKEAFDYIGSLHPDYLNGFRILWNSSNKDYPWEMNPWVFPYAFRLEVK